ncbi:hypothetical protein EV426DRAFT_721075 [Tirmania nivea]|nr:hypothetical protein EV426DRAFT_721075 [Tirmania nivea]
MAPRMRFRLSRPGSPAKLFSSLILCTLGCPGKNKKPTAGKGQLRIPGLFKDPKEHQALVPEPRQLPAPAATPARRREAHGLSTTETLARKLEKMELVKEEVGDLTEDEYICRPWKAKGNEREFLIQKIIVSLFVDDADNKAVELWEEMVPTQGMDNEETEYKADPDTKGAAVTSRKGG